MSGVEDTRAWVASKTTDGEWLEARVVSQADENGNVTLQTLEGETHTQPSAKLLLANDLPEEGVENMTRLNYLHEPALLHNLQHRFARDHVYTYTGRICIAVNPFNWQVRTPAPPPPPAHPPTAAVARPPSARRLRDARSRPVRVGR
jgi:myosin heavy subunit